MKRPNARVYCSLSVSSETKGESSFCRLLQVSRVSTHSSEDSAFADFVPVVCRDIRTDKYQGMFLRYPERSHDKSLFFHSVLECPLIVPHRLRFAIPGSIRLSKVTGRGRNRGGYVSGNPIIFGVCISGRFISFSV